VNDDITHQMGQNYADLALECLGAVDDTTLGAVFGVTKDEVTDQTGNESFGYFARSQMVIRL
jgi:hypothetical protein